MPDTTSTTQTRDFEVDLSIGCVVTVPAHLVTEEYDEWVPKRLHNWPTGLVDAIEEQFAADKGIPVNLVVGGCLQVRPAGSIEDYSSE